MKGTTMILLSLLALTAACDTSPADVSPADAHRAFVDALHSRDPAVNGAAMIELLMLRRGVIDEILTALRESSDHSGQGPKAQAFYLVGQWRADEAVSLLTEQIDFALDPRTMVGKKMPSWGFYPALQALKQIGGATVRGAMLGCIGGQRPLRQRELCAFALSLSEGPEAAAVHLSLVIQKKDEAAAAPYRHAAEYIASGVQPSLPPDERGPK